MLRNDSLMNLSLNDMATIYRNTVDRGLVLLNFSGEVALRAGRPMRGRVQC